MELNRTSARPTGIGFSRTYVVGVVSFVLAAAIVAFSQDPSANVKDIPSFVKCLNDNIQQGANTNVSNAVMCIPKGCSMSVTMSQASAQAACNLGGCQLPRVILDCPRSGCRSTLSPLVPALSHRQQR